MIEVKVLAKQVVWSVLDAQFRMVVKRVLSRMGGAFPDSPLKEQPMIRSLARCWALILVVPVPEDPGVGLMCES